MRTLLVLLLSLLIASPAFAANTKAGKRVHHKTTVVKKTTPHKPRVIVKQGTPSTPVVKEPGCRQIDLKELNTVSVESPGYRVVQLAFDIVVSPGKRPAEEAEPIRIVFGVFYAGSDIRPDRDTYLKDLGLCVRDHTSPDGKFYPAGTSWLHVGFVPDEAENTDTTYRVVAEMPLPERLVAAKPRSYTRMGSGFYEASWEEDGELAVLRFTKRY